MTNKTIHCEKCKKQITKKDNANILAYWGVVPKAFCNNCYSSKERGFARHLFYWPTFPINSKMYLVGSWISTIIIPLLFIFYLLMFLFSKEMREMGAGFIIFMILFIALLLFILVWDWILYFKAKRKISGLE